ncbi:hypothetical protein [Actinoplanes sp. N902-109]|uniref:hypothetical protein n=1 Tax=Actinoplanes sp. (strain N902-109) TaxID=649831 RepID=UPI001E5F35FF|nr:hypothetical protein [Actinoplanes sp. N902-109]
MSKIELFAAIRRNLAAGMSGRAVEDRYRVGRRTVSAAAVSALPPPRKAMPSRGSKLNPFKPAIDEILRADLDAPRKQRHTVRRIYHRLLDEHDMADIFYQVVRTYVADRKPTIRSEAGRGPVKVFFPQTHRPGAEAEVDFGEVAINLRGESVTCMLFAFRMSFSGKAVHRIFASGASVSEIARETGLNWRTVKKYLTAGGADLMPPKRRGRPARGQVIDAFAHIVDA